METYFLVCLFLLAGLWYHHCNEITYRDRKLIKLCIDDNRRPESEYNKLCNDWDLVSYDSHMWYRMTFRNPLRLYSRMIQTKYMNYIMFSEV